jgi:hypothetical protein
MPMKARKPGQFATVFFACAFFATVFAIVA